MTAKILLTSSVALALWLQAGRVRAEHFHGGGPFSFGASTAAPARGGFVAPSPAPPSVTYGGFAVGRAAGGWRRDDARRGVTYEFHGILDRRHAYRWQNRDYRWNGGAWVVIDEGGIDFGYAAPEPEPAYAPSPAPAPPEEPEDSLAADVQRALAKHGYNPGPINGELGEKTRDAIVAFQGDHHLEMTGLIGGGLLDALGLR